MSILIKPLRCVFFALTVASLGCNAQSSLRSAGSSAAMAAGSAGVELTPEMARRVAVLIRAHSDVPPEYAIHVGPRTPSDVPGYDAVKVDFAAEGKMVQPITFLLSTDGNTLAQFRKFDISKDPKSLVSGANRPARGGTESAPVLIVVFDDLECPYCARANAGLIPPLLERYKDRVRVVYRDFPEEQHPWAMHAAIDTNCVGAESGTGYWNLVDYIHAHADEFGGPDRTLAKANDMLDTVTRDEARKQKLDGSKVEACIAKQDATAVNLSVKEGVALGVSSTPTIYINGEKIEGAQPSAYVFRTIDGALVAAGMTPPAAPVVAAPAKAAAIVPTPVKPGS